MDDLDAGDLEAIAVVVAPEVVAESHEPDAEHHHPEVPSPTVTTVAAVGRV
eukprot:CAMPEP_0176471590 /NCGR_PEP_ID=MMETSP0127-20121128/41212_1 /TAXON_ID=938130 /ORGANISM="Platyophrya macrostoma, Strain WH" /LENGTH=50 /DNA_ID=CAMNT_0017866245 /DNA_START=142 /DNA_END=290 /DNA_ORIENTATION=+